MRILRNKRTGWFNIFVLRSHIKEYGYPWWVRNIENLGCRVQPSKSRPSYYVIGCSTKSKLRDMVGFLRTHIYD